MPETRRHIHGENRLFELLLRAELVGVTTLALAAVGSTGRETGLRVVKLLVGLLLLIAGDF
jgi:hypothetical protein